MGKRGTEALSSWELPHYWTGAWYLPSTRQARFFASLRQEIDVITSNPLLTADEGRMPMRDRVPASPSSDRTTARDAGKLTKCNDSQSLAGTTRGRAAEVAACRVRQLPRCCTNWRGVCQERWRV